MKTFITSASRLLCLLFIVTSCPSISAQRASAQLDSLFTTFKAAAAFDNDFPRESVYLHLDNNAYLENDTLWFKAYVVRASTLRPTPLSRVLYAELLNTNGAIMQRKLLRIDSAGQTNGEFVLNLPIRSGYYEVRAYTREMLNWGTEACFSRVIPVFAKSNDNNLSIRQPQENTTSTLARPRTIQLNGRQSARRLSFFPEGGHRTKGVPQRMAYVLTDGRGLPVDDSLRVFDANGQLIAMSRTEHEGMGTFDLPPETEACYAVTGKTTIEVPAPDPTASYGMHADRDKSNIRLILSGNAAADNKGTLGLGIFCREQATYFDTLHIGHENVELLLPLKVFRGGVNDIVLFDAKGHRLCHRLVWKDAPERATTLKIRQNKSRYEAFEPIALELRLTDNNGKPRSTTFSLSVRDDGGELDGNPETATAVSMLLSSEIRGYVHRPEFYFASNDAPHRRALDLLLMTQGWTANDFETLCRRDTFIVRQPIEEKLTLNGQTFRDNNKRRPYPGLHLHIRMYNKSGGSLEGETVTDKDGYFAFASNVDFKDEWIAQFSTRNDKDKRTWSRIALDRWFSPTPRSLDRREISPQQAQTPRSMASQPKEDIDTFAWKDTIPRVISSTLLHEAVTIHKNRYKGLIGGRYTYRGGEKAGMRNSDLFYNLEQEVERYKDNGGAAMYLFEFLPFIDKDFSVEQGDPAKLRYRNRQPAIALNNEFNYKLDLSTFLAEDMKSVGIISPSARADNMFDPATPSNGITYETAATAPTGSNATGENSTSDVSAKNNFNEAGNINTVPMNYVLFYEDADAYRFRSKKGIEKRHIQGYSSPMAFRAPYYNGLDLPSAADVRRTLFWNPSVKTDTKGQASTVFYNNSRDGVRLRISARGITADGLFVDYEQ